jgi:hypothetical protein
MVATLERTLVERVSQIMSNWDSGEYNVADMISNHPLTTIEALVRIVEELDEEHENWIKYGEERW